MRDFQPRSLGKTRLGTTAAASRPFGRLGPFVASLLRASERHERKGVRSVACLVLVHQAGADLAVASVAEGCPHGLYRNLPLPVQH